MIKFKKLFASLLSVFTVTTQLSPVLSVHAENEQASNDHVEVKAENEQSDSLNPEELTESDEVSTATEAMAAYAVADPSTGVTNVTFSAELFKGADKEKDGYVWHAASNSIGHGVGYRVNYSMSGVADIPANSIQIDMPVHIMKDSSDSYADTYEMALPTDEEFEETHQNDPDTIFAYKELDRDGDGENDTIRVYNKVEAKAGQNGYFELAYYTSKQTMEYTDGAKTDPFKAVMSIGTKSWNTEEIPFTVDSSVSIDSAEQYYPTKYKSWQSSWGDAVKPTDADRYIYLMYTVKSVVNKDSSQKYTFSFDTDISSKAGAVDIVGYKFSGNSTFQAENHADSQTLTDSRWDYVLVKYDREKFTSANSYTVKATITPTVTPAGGIDDATSKAVKQEFSWYRPVFVGLGSHTGVFVHGSGTWESDTDKQYYWDRQIKDYSSSDGRDYERYDLDELQDGNVDSLDSIRFIAHSDAYNGPWTIADGGDSKDPDSYFKKKVTSSLESGTKYLEDFADDVVIDNSYKFTSQPLTSDDYSLSYFTYKIRNEYRTLDDDTLKFSNVISQSYDSDTVYTFYAKYGKSDEWVKAGTYKPSTGKAGIADTAHVESITGDTVRFKNGSEAVSYKVETSNASYSTSIYVEEFINLKNSTTVMNSIKGKQIAYIANKADFHVYDEAGNELGSDTNWDFDRMIRAQKDSEITKKAVSATNNRKQKQYAITWRVAMSETITSGAGGGTKQLIPQNGGVFYDLLPEGAVFNDSSIYVTDETGGEISSSNYTVTATPNFRDTNRTMVKIDIASSAKSYMLYYDTIHSWNDIKDYGTDVVNPVAYETKNDKISNGYYDDPTKPSKESMGVAFDDADLQKAFKDLDEASSDKPKFVYVKQNFDILAITAGSAGLSKKVLGDSSSNYSASGQTHTGGEYSYKIRYQNTFTTKASDLVFYDSLENYTTPEGKTSDWHGTLTGVGVNQMAEKGVSPAVYISTVENLDLNAHHDLSDTSVWAKADSTTDFSSAKAVAVDARYTDDGSSYVLQPGESLTAYLYMKAPETDVAQVSSGYPYAYNNVYASSTLADGSSSSDYFVHQDYSKIYYVVAGDLNMKKVNANNTDEPISGIKYRLYGTSDYGNSVDMILDTAKDGTIAFKGVERGQYILQEYDCGDDWLIDPTEYNVTIDADGNTSVANGDYSTGVLTLTDAPRVHADVRFSKKNLVTNKNLEGAKFMLKGTSDYGNKVVKYATSSTAGITGFANIEKGTYDITEVETPDGYVKNDTVYTVVIDESGNYTMAVKSGDEDFIKVNGNTISVYNEPLHNVTILKQNNYDYSAVEGVTFKISGTSDKGTAVDQNQTTNKAGMATFTGLESGTYTLVETAVAENADGINVELDTTPRVITVDKYGTATIEGTNKDSQGNTIIVDNAKSDKTITVIKKFNDEEPVDHSSDLPTIHASTNDPTKSSSVASNESAISEASLDDVQDDKSVVDSVVDGVKNVGKAIKNLFVTEAHAEETYTVTYDAGDGQFDDGSKTNTVTYTVKSDPVVKYSHTDNVDDTGKQNGNYGNSEKKTDVVTIPGADQLTVTVTYGGESATYDYVSIFSGSHSDYTAESDHSKADIEKQLGGGQHTSQTVTYTVQGDSVTFAWRSDSSGCGDGYGYYATVTYSGSAISGSYKRPTVPEGKKLDGWAAAKNGTVVYPKTGIPDTKKITSSMTLYAVYSDFQWYDDWEYTLYKAGQVNNENIIWLTKYKGDEITYKMPAIATIGGVTYKTSFGNTANSLNDSIKPFDTGAIENLSFENNFQLFGVSYFPFSCLFSRNSILKTVDMTEINFRFDALPDYKKPNFAYMFNRCNNLISISFPSFNTSNVTDMNDMFYNCSKLTSLDVSHFDTSKVTRMDYMFFGCSSLTSLDVSHFDTSKVTNMNDMFCGCSKLTSLDVSHFDTSKVTGMVSMFDNCKALRVLDVSHFNTAKVTGMGPMFMHCNSLTSLDTSGFDTSNVTTMNWMFWGCNSLTSLDVSGFDTSKVTRMDNMFSGCSSLTSLDVSNFSTSKVTDMSGMFYNCSSLTSLDVFAHAETFANLRGLWSSIFGENTYSMVSNQLSRIRLHKGNGDYSTKLGACVQQMSNSTAKGYTGNWTAFSEYNHANGSDLTPDINDEYVSLQQTYFSITDEQWAENPDGIWFVWEKEGQDPANQNYTSKAENFYTPSYDANGKVEKTPEQMFTKNGYWQKIDASTYSYTFYVVDADRPFYIWEDEMAGYTSSNTADNPIRIKTGSETATITNTSQKYASTKTGNLAITKTVVNSSTTQKFPFTVTITKSDGSALSGTKVFGTTAFKDGVAKTSLASGESLTIPDIPEGYHYTVAEDALSGYTVTSTNAEGTITGDQTATAAFTNTALSSPDVGNTGTLVLKKQNSSSRIDMPYDFALFFTNLKSKGTYSYTQQYARGLTGGTDFTASADGTAYVELSMYPEDAITISDLPDDATATVTQMSNVNSVTSYTVESTTDNIVQASATSKMSDDELTTAEEPIAAGNTKTITFDDAVEITKDLFIGKIVDGPTTDKKFEMTVDISGLKPNSVINTDTVGRITADADGYATKSFFLSHHEGVVISGLPVGATYTVTETGTPDYQGEYSISGKRHDTGSPISLDDRISGPGSSASGTGVTARDMTTEPVTIGADDYPEHQVIITNHYVKTYSLSVSNSVTGNMGDKSKTFSFTAQMPASLYGKTITTTKPDGSPAYTQVSSTGTTSFTLKHGETIVFSGLTTDEITALKNAVNYGISQENYAKEGYKTTYNSSESNGNLKVSVTNSKSSGVPTGNHIGTGITASIIIGLGAIMMLLKKKKDE